MAHSSPLVPWLCSAGHDRHIVGTYGRWSCAECGREAARQRWTKERERRTAQPERTRRERRRTLDQPIVVTTSAPLMRSEDKPRAEGLLRIVGLSCSAAVHRSVSWDVVDVELPALALGLNGTGTVPVERPRWTERLTFPSRGSFEVYEKALCDVDDLGRIVPQTAARAALARLLDLAGDLAHTFTVDGHEQLDDDEVADGDGEAQAEAAA